MKRDFPSPFVLSALLWGGATGFFLPLVRVRAETYTVTEGSEVRYYVRHPLHKVVGINREVTGSFTFSLTKPAELSGLRDQVIRVRWDRFDSGNRNRDAQVRKAVKASEYPEVVFRIRDLEGFQFEGGRGKVVVRGFLYIAGHRQMITAPVEFTAGEPSSAEGSFSLRMSDFGIDPPSLLFLKASDEVRIEFSLRFARTP